VSGTRYASIAFSAPVAARQRASGSITSYGPMRPLDGDSGVVDTLDTRVAALIEGTDSFFVGTVTPDGWPYLQHRGGPPGFTSVLDPSTIAFADYPGNQQYVTLGNLDANAKITLFFIDYPTRTRIKVYGRARIVERTADPDFVDKLASNGGGAHPVNCERAIVVDVEALDMNCRKNIPVKYGEASIRERVRLARADLLEQIEALTRRNAELETAAKVSRQ
jgi:uncharacterized protein